MLVAGLTVYFEKSAQETSEHKNPTDFHLLSFIHFLSLSCMHCTQTHRVVWNYKNILGAKLPSNN